MHTVNSNPKAPLGFTVVELLIVVVVIGIIAAIAIIGYSGVARNAVESTMRSDLKNAATALKITKVQTGDYPVDVSDIPTSGDNIFSYQLLDNDYCLSISSNLSDTTFYIRGTGDHVSEGLCVVAVDTISAAYSFTCAILHGRPYCWGYGAHGRLGDGGGGTNSNVPVAVSTSGILAGKTVTAISAGSNQTCAIADGRAYCWGTGTWGTLGNGTTTGSDTPVAVSTDGVLAGKTVTAISSGDSNCAVAGGKAYCWGLNSLGQLGNGTTTNSNIPVAVSTDGVLAGRTVTAIAAGANSNCAIADGRAYCWGNGTVGALGNGENNDSNVPVAVSVSGVLAGKTVTAIASGSGSSVHCAIADGGAYCWGFGALGNGPNISSNVPVAVSTDGVLAGKTVTDITVGSSHACVIADGRAYCWGSGGYGRLGRGSGSDSNVPVAVSTDGVLAGKTVTSIAAGNGHTCAVADGEAYCWGGNYMPNSGQLGNGTNDNSSIPIAVSPLT